MENLRFPLTRKEADAAGIEFPSEDNKASVFATRLRELRKGKGVSQQALADELGFSKSTISLYEQGDTVPDIKAFVKIADFYDVSYDYLLGNAKVQKRENIDIAEKTGLTDEAIDTLMLIKELSEKEQGKKIEDVFIGELQKRNSRYFLKILNLILSELNYYKFFNPIVHNIILTFAENESRLKFDKVKDIKTLPLEIEKEYLELADYKKFIEWTFINNSIEVLTEISNMLAEQVDPHDVLPVDAQIS